MKKLFLILLLAFQFGHSQIIIDAYTPFGTSAPFNYYTPANAANPTPNEVNATTGLGTLTNFTASSVTSTPTPFNGTYCLKFTSTGPTNTSGTMLLTLSGLTIGQSYEIRIRYNRLAGNNYRIILDDFRGWSASVNGTLITTSMTSNTWYEDILTGTASSTTPTIRIACTGANIVSGDAFVVDDIRIYNTADL